MSNSNRSFMQGLAKDVISDEPAGTVGNVCQRQTPASHGFVMWNDRGAMKIEFFQQCTDQVDRAYPSSGKRITPSAYSVSSYETLIAPISVPAGTTVANFHSSWTGLSDIPGGAQMLIVENSFGSVSHPQETEIDISASFEVTTRANANASDSANATVIVNKKMNRPARIPMGKPRNTGGSGWTKYEMDYANASTTNKAYWEFRALNKTLIIDRIVTGKRDGGYMAVVHFDNEGTEGPLPSPETFMGSCTAYWYCDVLSKCVKTIIEQKSTWLGNSSFTVNGKYTGDGTYDVGLKAAYELCKAAYDANTSVEVFLCDFVPASGYVPDPPTTDPDPDPAMDWIDRSYYGDVVEVTGNYVFKFKTDGTWSWTGNESADTRNGSWMGSLPGSPSDYDVRFNPTPSKNAHGTNISTTWQSLDTERYIANYVSKPPVGEPDNNNVYLCDVEIRNRATGSLVAKGRISIYLSSRNGGVPL